MSEFVDDDLGLPANEQEPDQPVTAGGNAPDFIPEGQEPWAAAPDFIPEGQEPWAAEGGGGEAPDFIPEGQEPWKSKKDSSALGTFARAAGIEAIPFAASLAPMAAGAGAAGRAAAPFGPLAAGAAALVGGAVTGGIASYAAQKAQQAAGIQLDPEQEAADEEQHPWARTAGRLFPNIVAFSPGKLADSVAQRLLMGVGMGAIDVGSQAALNGEVNAGQALEAAAVGAVFNRPRAGAQKIMGPAHNVGETFADRVMRARDPATDVHVAASEPEKNGVGTAQEQPKPIDRSDVIGNPDSAPVESESNYSKRRKRMEERAAAEDFNREDPAEQPMPEDIRAAMEPAGEQPVVDPSPLPRVEETGQATSAPPDQAPAPQPTQPSGPAPLPQRPRMLPPVQDQHLADVQRAEGQGIQRAQAPRPDQMGELARPEPHPLDQPNPVADRTPVPQGRVPERVQTAQETPILPERVPERGPLASEIPVTKPPPVEIRPQPVEKAVENRPQPEKLNTVEQTGAPRKPRILEDLRPEGRDLTGEGRGGAPSQEELHGEPRKPRILEDLTQTRPEEPILNRQPRVLEDISTPAPEVPVESGKGAQPKKPVTEEERTDKHVVDYDGRVIARAGTVREANQRSASLRLAKETMDKTKFADTDVRKPEEVAALREAAKKVVEEAEAQGFKEYRPRERKEGKDHQEAPPHALWMSEVKAFAKSKRVPDRAMEEKRAADFVAREKLLRAGDEESADMVRSDRRTAGDEFFRPHRGEAGEVTSEGNIAPKRAAPQAMRFGKRGVAEEEPGAIYAGAGVNGKVTPKRSMKLRDALKPDEQMFIGGPFSDEYSDVAKRLVAARPNVNVHVIDAETMAKIWKTTPERAHNGFYDFAHDTIFLKEGADMNTLLHEAVHAALGRKIDGSDVYKRQIKRLMEEIDPDGSLKKIFPEAFVDEHEFLAYGMTEPAFQAGLAHIQLRPVVVQSLGLKKQATMLDAFIETARRILGMGREHMSALEGIIRLTERGIDDVHMPTPNSELGKAYIEQQKNPVRQLAPQVMRDRVDDIMKQVKGPLLLRLRDTDKIAQSADRFFGGPNKNPIRIIADHVEMARVKGLELSKEAHTLLDRGTKLREQDPAGFHDLETLMQDESQYQRFGDLTLSNHPFRTRGINEEFRNARHADLEQRWNALPDELKNYRADLYDFTEARHNALADQTASSRLLKELGLDDPALARRVMDDTLTAADFQRLGPTDEARQAHREIIAMAGEINKLAGPYTPFVRRGGYAVTGEFKVPGTNTMLRETVPGKAWETDNKQTAIDFAKMQHGRPHIDSYYVAEKDDPAHGITAGDRGTKSTAPITKDGVDLTEPGSGRALEKERTIPFDKNDPNVVQRWSVRVEKGYLKMLDTRREQLAHEAELHRSDLFDKTDAQPKKYQPYTDAVTLASNLTNLEAKLKHNILYEGMDAKAQTAVKQLLAESYLQMQASTRIASSKLHRNFVKGADDNVLRNTFDYSNETATTLARLEHQPHIDKAREDAEAMVNADPTTSHAQRATLNEIDARLDAMKNGGFRLASGQMGPLQQRLMAWSYTARLATPGFTIRNLTQPALMSLPEIGSRHGFVAAGRELMKIYKDIGGGHILAQGAKDTGRAFVGKLTHPENMLDDLMQRRGITNDDKFAIKYMVERGRIDPDAGFQMGETLRSPDGVKLDFNMFGMKEGARRDTMATRGIEGGLNKLDTGLHWIEEVSRQMPRAAETINRVVTGLGAFRLEMKKNGGDREKAARYADDVVKNTQFVYSDTNKPTWQRNPFARAAFQFKQFGKSTYEFLGRHIARSIDSQATPAERSASRKALGGLFMTHTIMAGALGLPWEPVRALLIGAKQLGWTNKEWDDVENGIREAFTGFGNLTGLNEKNAKKLGEVLSRGLPRLAGIDFSPGLGLDNMMLFGSPRSGTDRELDNNLSAWMFNMIAGAPTALQMQMVAGMRDLIHGDYAKGIEKLMPAKIGSDVVKAGVGLAEGKKNARGKETAPPYSLYQAGVKALGMPVGEEAERNSFQHQVYQQATGERTDKAKLISDWLKADSPGAKDKASRAAFDAGIKPVELTQAQQRMRSEERRTVEGVTTTKQSRPIADRLRKVYNFTQQE